MAKLSILKGATSVLVRIFIQDTSKTNGAGLTGLTSGSSGLTCYVARDDDGNANATQLALSGGTRGTWSSGGLKEKDATNQPGVYELGLSNASIATGSRSCTYYLQGAANMAPCVFEVELTNVDNQSTAFGLSIAKTTNITGFNDIAATAVVSSGAITTSGGAVSTVSTVTNGVTVTTNNDKTGYSLSQTFPSNFSSLAITAGGAVKIDGTSALTESYAALHASPTLAQLLYEVRALLAENSISGTTVTTHKIDGSTTAHTYTLDSSTAPTSITTAS